MILHYNGTSWSSVFSTGTTLNELHGVWGTSASDVWAVGYNGTILHYNGTSWSSVSSGTPSTSKASGAPPRLTCGLWAPWDDPPLQRHELVERLERDDAKPSAASGAPPRLTCGLWAAFGTILHYNGTSWSSVSSGTTQDLYSVWGTSASDVWAVGGGGTILHYNGTSWSSVSSGTTLSLYSVWGSSPSNVWAVGDGGTILHGSPDAGPASSIVKIGTDPKNVEAGASFSDSIRVQATDFFGKLMSEVVVTFAATAGGGSVTRQP